MTRFAHNIVAAFGAAIFTFTAVGAAVGPARAVETDVPTVLQASVSGEGSARA